VRVNGARSLDEFRTLIGNYRSLTPTEDPNIGCTILSEPFFLDKSDWIPSAPYLQGPVVSGKGNFDSETALRLWLEVTGRLAARKIRESLIDLGPATAAALETARYGRPILVAPRLGQGSFRALVTKLYRYRCAISSERTLPVLQAAHIRPYAEGGRHELSNGLLLRSDLHTLFDQHYLTVEPNKRTIVVSRRIREQFENGRDYYAFKDHPLVQPGETLALPSTENLEYHLSGSENLRDSRTEGSTRSRLP
jgi:putative restriction endonuclease